MTEHNPFVCLWRRFGRPWFVSGAERSGTPPEGEELTPAMKDALVDYVYQKHNLDDFVEWVLRNRMDTTGADNWHGWFLGKRGQLCSSPMPGWIFAFLTSFVPIVVVVGVVFFFTVGVLVFFFS